MNQAAKDVLDRRDWDGLSEAVQLANDYVREQEQWMADAYFAAQHVDPEFSKSEFIRYVHDRVGLLGVQTWRRRLYQGLRQKEGKPTSRLEAGNKQRDPERHVVTFCRQVAKLRSDYESLIRDNFDPDGAYPPLAVFEDWESELGKALDDLYAVTGPLKKKLSKELPALQKELAAV